MTDRRPALNLTKYTAEWMINTVGAGTLAQLDRDDAFDVCRDAITMDLGWRDSDADRPWSQVVNLAANVSASACRRVDFD